MNAALPRIFCLLIIAQLLVILIGVAITGSLMRDRISSCHMMSDWNAGSLYVQYMGNRGLWLSLLPLGWAVAAVMDARIQAITKRKVIFRFELVGWLLLCGLLFAFVYSALSAYAFTLP